MGMTVKERYLMCYKARICASCHDPDYVWKPNDSNHNCLSYGKKGRFSCKEKECKLHMWVCDKHQRANKEALEKFRDKYKADYNLDFGLVVIGSVLSHISPTSKKSKLMKKPTTYHSKSTKK